MVDDSKSSRCRRRPCAAWTTRTSPTSSAAAAAVARKAAAPTTTTPSLLRRLRQLECNSGSSAPACVLRLADALPVELQRQPPAVTGGLAAAATVSTARWLPAPAASAGRTRHPRTTAGGPALALARRARLAVLPRPARHRTVRPRLGRPVSTGRLAPATRGARAAAQRPWVRPAGRRPARQRPAGRRPANADFHAAVVPPAFAELEGRRRFCHQGMVVSARRSDGAGRVSRRVGSRVTVMFGVGVGGRWFRRCRGSAAGGFGGGGGSRGRAGCGTRRAGPGPGR